MVPNPERRFSHRENGDGTFDSICHQCFATIATADSEQELLEEERDHVCDTELLVLAHSLGSPERHR